MNEDLIATQVRITITNDQGEVWVGPCRVLVDKGNRIWIEDDDGELCEPIQLLRDAWGAA